MILFIVRRPSRRGGVEFVRGLCNYSSADIERIRGLRSEQVREAIGASAYDEVVHRDNLVVVLKG